MRKKALSIILAIIISLCLLPKVNTRAASIDNYSVINPGSSYSNSITETNSKQFYKFQLNQSGEVTLYATAYMRWVYYRIYDESGSQIWSVNPNWNSTTEIISTEIKINLTQGTYYFAVEKDGYNGSYNFRLDFASANESFAEGNGGSNNSINAADVISLNSSYNGQLAINDTKDFYQFYLASSGKVVFSATAHMNWIYYRLYNSSGAQLWSTNPNWNSTTELISTETEIDLTQGTYYLAVEKDGNNTGNYDFRMDFTSANESFAETDGGSDNLTGTANIISLNTLYRGQIALNDNKDFYQFSLDTSGEINLRAMAYMKWTYFRFYDDRGNQLWSREKSWDSASQIINIDEQISFDAGTYYLAVEKDSGYTGQYYFELATSQATAGTGANNNAQSGNTFSNGNSQANTSAGGASSSSNTGRTASGGSSSAAGSTGRSKTFPDVSDPSKAYYKPVYWAVNKGITVGYNNGNFGPADSCTRAQFVTFIWRMAGKPTPKAKSSSFRDVSASASSFRAIMWAVEKGIIVGYQDGTFRPSYHVTRRQVAVMLWRWQGKPSASQSAPFIDVSGSDSAYRAIQWGAQAGVIKGSKVNGRQVFMPDALCQRQQIVTFLYRYARDVLGERVN